MFKSDNLAGPWLEKKQAYPAAYDPRHQVAVGCQECQVDPPSSPRLAGRSQGQRVFIQTVTQLQNPPLLLLLRLLVREELELRFINFLDQVRLVWL